MKRMVVVLGLFAIVLGFSSTDTHAVTWEMGFRGGVSISHLIGSDFPTDSLGAGMSPGISGGLWAKSNFTRNIGLRVEATFVRKGAEETYTDTREIGGITVSADITARTQLDYFEIPILAVFTHTNETASTRLGVYCGPALAFNVGAEQTRQSGSLDVVVDLTDRIKSSEVGLMTGIESGFRIGENTLLTLDLRWTYGLSSIDDSDLGVDVKNSSFQLMMGVAFPLGGIIAPPPPRPEEPGRR